MFWAQMSIYRFWMQDQQLITAGIRVTLTFLILLSPTSRQRVCKQDEDESSTIRKIALSFLHLEKGETFTDLMQNDSSISAIIQHCNYYQLVWKCLKTRIALPLAIKKNSFGMGKNSRFSFKLLFIFENVTKDAKVEKMVYLISVGVGNWIQLGFDNTSASQLANQIYWWKDSQFFFIIFLYFLLLSKFIQIQSMLAEHFGTQGDLPMKINKQFEGFAFDKFIKFNQIQRLGTHIKQKSMATRNENKIKAIFRIIDADLSKFYSSRPLIEVSSGTCSCKNMKNDKEQQISFYRSQKEMITQAANALMQDRHSEEEQIFGKVLFLVTDYISKILELLKQENLCECKANAIAEHAVMKHKISFIREENDKFFRLLEEKNAECLSLAQKLEDFKNSRVDIRPITARHNKQNKENESRSIIETPSLFNFSEQRSITSSKISDTFQATPVSAKETTQKSHNKYFNIDASKKERKSKIFLENDYCDVTKSYKK